MLKVADRPHPNPNDWRPRTNGVLGHSNLTL